MNKTDKLIKEIDKYVKKTPPLPENIKELVVQLAPWLAVISVVFLLPALFTFFGIGTYFGYYGFRGYGVVHWGMRYTIMIVFFIANLVLRGLSISGLFDRSIKGWNYLFYSILLYFVYSIFNFDIVGGIITTLISLYLAFQVKSYYK